MKLLLADDDADQMELRSLTLANAGYQVRAARDVDAALRLAAEETPDAAVVDWKLPTEEAGLRLIRNLKILDRRIRVIVLTGADPKKFERLPERGLVEAVFIKGSASKQLLRHLSGAKAVELRGKLKAEGQLVLEAKVIPRSSKSEIVEIRPDGSLKVKLTALPENGKANEELISLMADYFDVGKDSVELIAGQTSRHKRLRIRAT